MRRRLVTLLATVALLAPATPALADHPLQPGAYHETDIGSCTLNFVYDGTGAHLGKVFLGSAAHCVADDDGKLAGDGKVLDIHGNHFGNVAAYGDPIENAADWALIEVLPSHIPRVSPAVAGHPAWPTGYATPSHTATGDRVQFSGYGLGFDLTGPTRERRFGLLTFHEPDEWGVAGPMNFGDSGGPLVHVRTGRALGLESRVCLGVCTDMGPTVQGLLERAESKGYTVTLRSVGP